jgi:penicillin-binding protein 1A
MASTASELTLAEAALIAGIIRAPAAYSPWTHFDAARRRSFVVLQRMREEKKITPQQEQQARQSKSTSAASAVSNARQGYAKEFLRQQFRDIYGGDNPPDWKVHTSFVPEVQDAAEAAVRNGLRQLGGGNGLQAALVAMDPSTGNCCHRRRIGLRADAVQRAVRSRRQPGSAFKPFVYSVALENGMSPVSTISGIRQVAVAAPRACGFHATSVRASRTR